MMVCPDCRTRFRPGVGHCRGGVYDGCCSSFTDARSSERHRVGGFGDGSRRCLSVAERVAAGWVRDGDGLWSHPVAVAAAARARGLVGGRLGGVPGPGVAPGANLVGVAA